jgi:AhpD family alkylhydroperoxidase
MTRIERRSGRAAGPLARTLLWLARREAAKLVGRSTERMIEPAELYAHAPGLLAGYGTFELATAKQRRVDERLKVLAELKAAALTTCAYCVDIGSQIARRAGISDEQMLALPHYRDSELFSELEKLAIDYAVAVSATPVEVPDELFARLREHFDERQIVELTNAIAIETMRGRFNLALGIGSAGFSEGRVCVAPERPGDDAAGAPERPPGGAAEAPERPPRDATLAA